MKYTQDKRGFWLIVNYRKQKYFGFLDEGILGKAINDNQTHETLLKIVENIAEKIKKKLAESNFEYGGKGQSIKEIVPYFQSYSNSYWEPMIGGDYPKTLIRQLERHKRNHSEEYYYKIRDQLNRVKLTGNNPPNVNNAGMFLYLNKAGFNGLYRENGKGLINVPHGHKEKVALFTQRNITEISEYLRTNNITIICQDYAEIRPQKGDFVYLDPPYDGTYNDYTARDFCQLRLKEYCDVLNREGIK
ncbi:36072_t:CDS:2 [Racocetra persica]|uniref:36072_t:CDS:1 n=1 Tax=Racocetra persica TaxID=160502 RepID=A0ACA9LWU0_9GLOM|nr:36072_t:CDS:2 [Racocetra persica]